MSLPSYFRLKHKSKTINGPISRFGEDGLFEIHEFRHGVSFGGWKFTLNPTAIRKHEPIVIVKPIDKISVLLYDVLCRSEYLQELEIFWPYYEEKTSLEQIYFKHILNKVR